MIYVLCYIFTGLYHFTCIQIHQESKTVIRTKDIPADQCDKTTQKMSQR